MEEFIYAEVVNPKPVEYVVNLKHAYIIKLFFKLEAYIWLLCS